MHQKLRLGMIGGGPGAFIGAVHRIAARMDNDYELVCGAFSSNAEKSALAGKEIGIPAARSYGSIDEMFVKEAALPADQRMEVVCIVTPNHLHFEPAKRALQEGFDVVLDKPITFSLQEAVELREILKGTDRLLCLTHTYAGYPMIKEARQRVLTGVLGMVRKVYVEYPQGWLYNFLEGTDNRQAGWRTDPARSGIAGAMGDIGTHAFHLAEYVSGLRVKELCADLHRVVQGRKLDDDGAALLRFESGASGVLMATQVATGEENNVRIRVYGEHAGLDWCQEQANTLLMKWPDKPAEVLRSGASYLSSHALWNQRTPPGHPEGYLEAFANHYRNFAAAIRARNNKTEAHPEWLDYPDVNDGVRGMQFVEAMVGSEGRWVEV